MNFLTTMRSDISSMHTELKNEMKKVSAATTTNTAKIESNTERIKALEAKVGDSLECAVPLSIALYNIPKSDTHDDLALAKDVIRKINAEEVNPDTDVVKAIRKGYKVQANNQTEKLGTICVELKSEEVRSKIMKAKKNLASLPDEGLTKGFSKYRVKNWMSQHEMNQQFTNRTLLKMIPE